MKHPLRALFLGVALACTPACAAFKLGDTQIAIPISAAHSIDQQAYALLHAYAAVLEEATDIVADPATPLAFKRALGQAERAATPAAQTLQISVRGYVRARAAFDTASAGDASGVQRAAAALAIAARELSAAIAAAEAPIAELQGLVRARRG